MEPFFGFEKKVDSDEVRATTGFGYLTLHPTDAHGALDNRLFAAAEAYCRAKWESGEDGPWVCEAPLGEVV